VKAIPKLLFENDSGGIEVRRTSIKITGSAEGAARAMAEAILNRKNPPTGYNSWDYMGVIDIIYCSDCKDNPYTVNLTGTGIPLIDLEIWNKFKKDVEKICNNLKAFL
jgi:hypothetical protein